MPIIRNILLAVFLFIRLALVVRSNEMELSKGVLVVDWNELKIIRFCAIRTSSSLFVAASPDELEKNFDYQIDVRAEAAYIPLKVLPGLFEQIRDNGSNGTVDCRYGLIGISKKGVRLFSIYLDGLTDRGFSGRKAIIAPPALKEWIKKSFPAPLGLTPVKWPPKTE